MKINRIYSRTKLLIVVIFSLVLLGCNVSFSIPAGSPVRLSVYQSNQRIIDRTVDLNDPSVIAINNWLRSHTEDWSLGFMTRAPEIYFQGKEFYINVSKSEVSVKFCENTKFDCNLWIKKDADLFVTLKKKMSLQHMSAGKAKVSNWR